MIINHENINLKNFLYNIYFLVIHNQRTILPIMIYFPPVLINIIKMNNKVENELYDEVLKQGSRIIIIITKFIIEIKIIIL